MALIDEKRMRALYHVQGYQKKIKRAFNKKVKSRNQKEREELRGEISDPRGKMKPRWRQDEANLDGEEKFQVVNMARLQKYNHWKKEKKKAY